MAEQFLLETFAFISTNRGAKNYQQIIYLLVISLLWNIHAATFSTMTRTNGTDNLTAIEADAGNGSLAADSMSLLSGDFNWNVDPGTFSDRIGLTQILATKDCIGFMWSKFKTPVHDLELSITNTKTNEIVTQPVPPASNSYKLCGLDEQQRYKVKLTNKPGTNDTDIEGETMELYMWTKQAIPSFPPEPAIVGTGDKTITLGIYEMDFDIEKGPFTGFDIIVIKTSELGKTGSRRRRDTYTHGVPPGVSVGFLKVNKEQGFEIGADTPGNPPLETNTEYTISVGAVSHLLGESTHAYVTVNASTSDLNIYVITMVICLLLGLTLLACIFIFLWWKRKKEEEDKQRIERGAMMLYLGEYNGDDEEPKEYDGVEGSVDEDDRRLVGVLGSPEVVRPYVQSRHPWMSTTTPVLPTDPTQKTRQDLRGKRNAARNQKSSSKSRAQKAKSAARKGRRVAGLVNKLV